ncbi:MAG: BatA and WFA domain-containing protein [Akkermansiaceae bacterium]|nr:BatA and WFA domain-containing protein [Akkermansiaceae bacterium]
MGFLSPFLLASFAALAVPLWLHLRRRRRQQPVEFPSLRYLKTAAARMKRQARVEDLGLLLLRLLLMALLAAAFARPVVRSSGGWLGAGRSVESVVVIDATASMGWRGSAGSRLDAAKRLAREWVDGLDRSDAVALWVLTDKLEQPVPVPIADRGYFFQQLDALMPAEGSASLASVFNAAREWAETRSPGRKELVVITDNQPAAWDWPAEGFFRSSWQRGNTHLVVLASDSLSPSNLSVAAVEWGGKTVREGALLIGVARLENHGGTAASDLLECRFGDRVVLRKPVEIPAGGSLDVPLSLTVAAVDGPMLVGELALAGDGFAGDDHWYFALPVRRPGRALVIERGGGAGGGMHPAFFLTKALAAGGAGRAEVLDAPEWEKQATADFDSIWFTGGSLTGDTAWPKALAYTEAGGTVVLTGDSQPEPLPAAWPVSAGEETRLPAGRMATRLLTPTHPLFDGVWSERMPFPPLPQRTARRCTAADGGRVLATLAGEFPLLVEAHRGLGRIYWLNASADRGWGDLPLSPVYVALVQQLGRAGDLALQTGTSAWVGESWPDLSSFGGRAAWSPTPPGEQATRVLHSGVFDALANDGTPLWRCAVNVRRAESELRPLDPAKLQAMLPGRLATGTGGIREWRETIRREVPLWPWLLGAAALVFIAEGWVATRAAARRGVVAGTALPKGLERRGWR